MIQLSDQDILSRLTDTEDSTVERKTASDYRDCLKSVVAFSNSLPVGDPGIVFVGVGNDGTVQDNLNLETLQKNVSKELSKIYPAVFPQMKVLRDSNGKELLCVIVRGSENRPHFAGPSYIRDGTETKEASEEQFARLIAERNSKVREILKSRGRPITLWFAGMSKSRHPATGSQSSMIVVDCNQFYVSLSAVGPQDPNQSFPLADLDLAYDYQNNCLMLRFLG